MGGDVKTIVLVGYLGGEAGAVKCRYLERLDHALRSQGHRLLLIEQGGRDIETTCDVHELPAGVTTGDVELSDAQRSSWKSNPMFQNAVETDAAHFTIESEEAARRCLVPADHIQQFIQQEQAALCILWHQFNGIAYALAEHCERLAVPVLYAHLGPLPGTITFEAGGQMAESWVCRENARFVELPVTEQDLEIADRYIKFVREMRSDRKIQLTDRPIEPVTTDLRTRSSGLIFYAGQNDFRTGMAPRSLPHATEHSPFFDDTYDALAALAKVAAERNWGVIFKPHPNIPAVTENQIRTIPDNVALVEHANIFECILETDVTITVLSSTAYLSLIHNRPVVLLGRMSLSGKGCVYEATSRENIGDVINAALTNGFTDEQKQHWRKHTAQLIRHYLFAYDDEAASRIGRDVDAAAAFILPHCN